MRPIAISAVMAGFLGVAPVHAGDPPPFPDFTFKRVKVPEAGAKKRILVQIDPSDQWLPPVAAPVDATPPGSPATESTGKPALAGAPYAWFWNTVPSGGTGTAGLTKALSVLARPPHGAEAPRYRLDSLRRLADRYGTDILKSTVGTRVSPALVLAVMAVESSGRENAVSSAGAEGLMQLMPATAKRFGVSDSRSPAQNIRGGVAYLDWLMGEFGGDPLLVLAGYNAGEGAVTRHAGVPPYAETRGYVPKVLAAFDIARGLCLTPPMLVSDGCVFVGTDRLASRS